jgi:hypothetical protein
MAILPLAHNRKSSFDDVDVRKEVGFEGVLNDTNCSAALAKLLYGSDDSCIC